VGTVIADGGGNLFTTGSATTLSATVLVGTYKVNTDCSTTLSLNDPFPATAGGTPPTVTPITLEGEIVDSKIESVQTNPNAAGATVTFTKMTQFNSCSNASLLGNFGISGSGVVVPGAVLPPIAVVPPGSTGGAFSTGVTTTFGTPFNLLGRFNTDGAGNFLADNPLLPPVVKRTLTGTYVVNINCSGTAKLTDATTGTTRNISFVLVNDFAAPGQLSLQFVFSDPGVIGEGTAIP
jgi:hypothetical protein